MDGNSSDMEQLGEEEEGEEEEEGIPLTRIGKNPDSTDDVEVPEEGLRHSWHEQGEELPTAG